MGTITIKHFWSSFHRWINGAPSEYISLAMITVAILLIIVAVFAPAEIKAVVLAWVVFP